MAITADQDIPEKPKTQEPWTFRRLFPMKAAVSALTKNFTNPFDALLAFLILGIVIGELVGRQLSWMIYILAGLVLFADIIERQKLLPSKEKKKKK